MLARVGEGIVLYFGTGAGSYAWLVIGIVIVAESVKNLVDKMFLSILQPATSTGSTECERSDCAVLLTNVRFKSAVRGRKSPGPRLNSPSFSLGSLSVDTNVTPDKPSKQPLDGMEASAFNLSFSAILS